MSDKINFQSMLDFIMSIKKFKEKKTEKEIYLKPNNQHHNYIDIDNSYSNNDDIINIFSHFLNGLDKTELKL